MPLHRLTAGPVSAGSQTSEARPGRMNAWTKARLLAHVGRWVLTWNRRDTHTRHGPVDNPRFLAPLEAARLVKDGAVVFSSGLGGNARPSILYWAIREAFQTTGHPRDLTCMAVGGIGGRGRAPGTYDELGLAGLCTRFCAGHLETFKALLALADAGRLELQCLPEGIMALLLEAQGRGVDSLTLRTGVGTFMDPRVGRGSPVLDPRATQLVSPDGERLRYTMPKVDVAIFNLPAADAEGNVYARHAAMIAECREAALAARRNGGIVICTVGLLVPKRPDEIFLSSDHVDALVLYPGSEQTASVPHRTYWPLLTTESDQSLDEGMARLKLVNRVLGITPRRDRVDDALARLAAWVFARYGRRGMNVNIGVGLPEEVCRVLHQGGLTRDITLFTEAGVVGGLPAPGVFFGAAVCPRELVSSAQIFKDCYEKLDATVLGILEADSEGNVNLSSRGPGAANQVGPGGSLDLTAAARMVLFVGSWMAHGRLEIAGGRLCIVRHGAHKFVDRVSEITFCGREALRAGKQVFYCTNVGAFRLTERGMELLCVLPGVDVRRDVIDACPMKVVLPASGEVDVVSPAIVTGDGFQLHFPD
jgi:propionate CoA-transferase